MQLNCISAAKRVQNKRREGCDASIYFISFCRQTQSTLARRGQRTLSHFTGSLFGVSVHHLTRHLFSAKTVRTIKTKSDFIWRQLFLLSSRFQSRFLPRKIVCRFFKWCLGKGRIKQRVKVGESRPDSRCHWGREFTIIIVEEGEATTTTRKKRLGEGEGRRCWTMSTCSCLRHQTRKKRTQKRGILIGHET